MNFGDAIVSVFRQYVGFSGRARRSEYWWFALFGLILDVVITIVDAATHTVVLAIVVGLVLLLPGLAVGARRLHDTGRSGWWLLIGLIPLAGAIILIVFFCQDSERGTNRFGPSPKYGGGHPGGYGQYPYPGQYPDPGQQPYPGQPPYPGQQPYPGQPPYPGQ